MQVFLMVAKRGKVDNPYSVTFLFREPIFKQYVVWCGSKNRYQKDMSLKEIALRDNYSRLNSQHILGGNYVTNEHMSLQFENKIFI